MPRSEVHGPCNFDGKYSCILELSIKFYFWIWWHMGIIRINILLRTQHNKNFLDLSTQFFFKRDFLVNALAKIFVWLRIRNQFKIPRRMMCIIIWFIFKLPIFPIFCISSRLRKNDFIEKRRQIYNESYYMIHIMIYINRGILRWFRIWSQKIFLPTHLREKCAEFAVKFWFEIYPYVIKSKIITPRIADVLKIEFYR